MISKLSILRSAAVLLAAMTFGLLVRTAGASTVIYVDNDAPPAGDGTSWSTAFNDLQAALAGADAINETESVEIRVAQGVYHPAPPNGDRTISFRLLNNVTLLGGFAGLDAIDPGDRDINRYSTVLSGDLNQNDVGDAPNASWEDNSFHVVVGGTVLHGDTVDGLTVTRGVSPGGFGGGMRIEGRDFTVSRCRFLRNYCGDDAGGVWVLDASPRFIECDFVRSLSGSKGGAMRLDVSRSTVERCRFIGNRAAYGGAITMFRSSPVIRDCLFNNNAATDPFNGLGGAVYVRVQQNYPIIENCTFVGNVAEQGAAFFHASTGISTIRNCTFWGNADGPIEGDADEIIVTRTIVEGGWTGAGSDNMDVDPLFVDIDGLDGISGNEDDNLRLLPDSPAINAGDPAVVFTPGEHDLDGHARVLCGRVDMGAYEFGIGDFDCDRDVNLFDFASWADCFTGPDGGPFDAACESLDFDGDLDVDWADYAGMQVALSAP